MSLPSIEHGRPSPDAQDALRILADAVARRTGDGRRRVDAALDSRDPSEGLALLAAYVGIEDRQIRQAVLDLLTALSDRSR